MTKKSREERRYDAEYRAKHYTWENSKAKRLGTATKEQWTKRQTKLAR